MSGYPQEKIKPYGTSEQKTEQVEAMFDHIAPAYDRLNRIMSLGIDNSWRKKAIRSLKPYRPQHILDIATGTGDFAFLACRMLRPRTVTGVDISEGMMEIARKKMKAAGLQGKLFFCKEDSTALTFEENSFDAVTVAFGIRNFADLDKGLREMYRVLQPGGEVAILELTAPEKFPMKQLFRLYCGWFIPSVGKVVSRDERAYRYLPETIRVFSQGTAMRDALAKAGFSDIRIRKFTLGVCTLYRATKQKKIAATE